MAIITTDLLVINRGGIDYKAPAGELPEFDSSALEALIKANADAIAALEIKVEANANAISNIKIGDGEITITESDGKPVGKFTVNQAGDATITLPQVVIPESLHPKGFINVANPAPADPEHGDIYIQSSSGGGAVSADASFAPGITGTVEEGVFVIFGVDDLWHAGGQANPTSVQTDWNETDVTSNAFLKNKPVIGNGVLEVVNHEGTLLVDFAANQEGSELLRLPAPPVVNNGKLEMQDPTGATKVTFSANQAGDQAAAVYLKNSYIQHLPVLS